MSSGFDMTEIGSIAKNKREAVQVTIGETHGRNVVDVRIVFENDDGEMQATKKGVNLRIEALPGLIELLQEAESQAKRRGWMPGPSAVKTAEAA